MPTQYSREQERLAGNWMLPKRDDQYTSQATVKNQKMSPPNYSLGNAFLFFINLLRERDRDRQSTSGGEGAEEREKQALR